MTWFENGVAVWGFRESGQCDAFYAWSLASGIDWSVPPDQQEHRPAPVPEATHFAGPTAHKGFGR